MKIHVLLAMGMLGLGSFSVRGEMGFTGDGQDAVEVTVDGQALANGFKVAWIKPGWLGNYGNHTQTKVIKAAPDAAQCRTTVGDFATCVFDITKVSAGELRMNWAFDVTAPVELAASYISVLLPMCWVQTGGAYSVDDGPMTPLPATMQRGSLFCGQAHSLSWKDGRGKGVRMTFPQPVLLQFQDNRQFDGATTFELMIHVPLANPGKTTFALRLEPLAGMPAASAMVDRFGQAVNKQWPGKVTTDAELRADVPQETAFLSRLNPPGRDAFGGWTGTRARVNPPGSGFFRVQKLQGRWWLVDPLGNVFFSLASFYLTCDTYSVVTGREKLFEWLPPPWAEPWQGAWMKHAGVLDCFSFYTANLCRKFGPEYGRLWNELSRRRWQGWGLNSTSAFSSRLEKVPWTPYLTLVDQAAPAIPDNASPDVFDPGFPAALDALCKTQVAPLKDDPYLLGYFFGNEQSFERIAVIAPTLPATFAIKQRLVAFLRERYPAIAAFNHAWALQAPTFESLRGQAFSAETTQARQDMDAFLELYLDTYGRTLRQTVKKYDPNHLLLGFRWLPQTAANATVVRTLGKYLDVLSVNYYANHFNGEAMRAVSQAAGGKPLILSEWSYGTNDRGHLGGCRDVPTLEDRGLYYREYVENAASLPFIVGCHWFQYVDQPLTGRFFGGANAETFNCGLVDITDRPYPELISALIKTNYRIYDVAAKKSAPFKFEAGGKPGHVTVKPGLAKIHRRTQPVTIDGGLDEWLSLEPTLRLTDPELVGGARQNVQNLRGDLWLLWDAQNLYVAARISDDTPLTNTNQGLDSWNGDCLELFFSNRRRPEKGPLLPGDWQVMLQPGCPEQRTPPGSWLAQKSTPLAGAEIKSFQKANPAEWWLEARIPLANFDGLVATPGLVMDFDAALDNNEAPGKPRTAQLMWHGTDSNHFGRSGWGRAELLP